MKMMKLSLEPKWEAIKGFDVDRTTRKGKYVRLDSEAWLDAHQIREDGAKLGGANQPASDQAEPDDMHRKIVSWVSKRALDCRHEVREFIDEKLSDLNAIGPTWSNRNPEVDIDAQVARQCQDLESRAARDLIRLDSRRDQFRRADRDLQDFCKAHRLPPVADYPSNQLAHWLWVPVAGIVESFVSANLLGGVARGGVFEGWMVALVLTLANVLLGIGCGWVARFTHVRRAAVKVLAWAACAACAAGALMWNGIAGHVRDVYVKAEQTGNLESIDKAFTDAYYVMVERPVPWESLASAGLVFVGIAVFALATYKMYSADDPYPGYGAKHRKVESLREEYRTELNDAQESLKSAHSKAHVAIQEIKDRYVTDLTSWENTQDELETVVNEYPLNLRQYNGDLAYLLEAYREENRHARTDPPPPFFAGEMTIDEELLAPLEVSVPPQPNWGDIPEKAMTGFTKLTETYNHQLKRYAMLESVDGGDPEDAT